MIKRIKLLLFISRPRFWIYILGPFIIGVFAGSQTLSHIISPLILFLILYFLFFSNFYLYGINDYFDYETDVLNTRKKKEEYKISISDKKIIKIVLFLYLSISAGILYFLPNFLSKILLLIFIFLATFYSAPPLRFKSKPFLDFFSNSLYIIPGLFGFSLFQNRIIPFELLISFSFWAFAMHLFSAIPDIGPDKKSGINTTAVILGKRKSLLLTTVFWSVFSIITLLKSFFLIPSLIYPLISFITLIKNDTDVNKVYKLYPYINLILGFLGFLFVFLSKYG